MNGTKYKVRIYQTLSEGFEVVTNLKQGNALSPLLFNIALEKAIRSVQNNNLETSIGTIQIDVLGFGDDLNLIGDKNSSTKHKHTHKES